MGKKVWLRKLGAEQRLQQGWGWEMAEDRRGGVERKGRMPDCQELWDLQKVYPNSPSWVSCSNTIRTPQSHILFCPFSPHLINFDCSNAAGAPLFHLLFFCLKGDRHERRKKEKLFSHWALIQHAIVPHIRDNRKAIHMQIPISLCTEHRLDSKLASQTLNNVGEDVSDNADVMRQKHQKDPETARQRKLSIKMSEFQHPYEDQIEFQDSIRHGPTFFYSLFTFCSENNLCSEWLVQSTNSFWFGCKAAMHRKWNPTTGVESVAKIPLRQLRAI